jgi:hypothetical protein
MTPADTSRRRTILIGAVLAALAWLSHGGVAFSFLVLTPWILWRCLRGEWRHWLWAALVFGLCAAPWIAYQKFYDPPGNRLLKWHLGGQIPKDARGTWQTIRENYSALSWEKIWENKRQNLAQQNSGRWEALVEFEPAQGIERRNQEFFITARAFTWWAVALLLFPLVWRRLDPAGDSEPPERRMHAALFWWTAITIPVWCLLLFQGEQAVIHQGSYATMLTAFVLLSAWFDRAGRGWLPLIALLQSVTLITTWLPGNSVVNAAVSPEALAFAGLSGAALAALAWIGWREPAEEAAAAEPMASVAAESPWDSALGWVAAGVALLPAIVCARALADLYWFGDDWDLLDQINRVGFWRWTLQPFAENFVPLFKVLWGGLVYAGGGAYWTLIAALWLTHALNTALFARLLRTAGIGLAGTIFATAIFALAAANIETLAWSVQWSALLAITFFLLAADLLIRRLNDGRTLGGLFSLALALLSAASALAFARGVLTGGALAVICLLPFGPAVHPWSARLRAAAACLLPAIAVAVTIILWSPGNHHSLGAAWKNAAQFGFCYWAGTPFHRLLGCELWHWPIVCALGVIKLTLVIAVLRGATARQRPLLVLLLVLDLGNAALLGIGRHHTGLSAANSERYYYMALLCTMPFLAVAFDRWLSHLTAPRLRLAFAAAVILLATWQVARGWPEAAEGFATHRGRNTRDLLLRQPNPPAENAVPGIAFLPTQRAKELITIYALH